MEHDRVRTLVRDLLKQHKLTMADLSHEIGRNHAYLQQFLERGVPAKLPEDVRHALAARLGCSEDELRPDGSSRPAPAGAPASPGRGGAGDSALPPGDPVPVYGYADARRADALNLTREAPIAHAVRHPRQHGASEVFAVYCVGDSMLPRYRPGELVYAIRGRWPAPEEDCIVELATGEGYLKQYLRREGEDLVCAEYQADGDRITRREWRRPLAEVAAVHSVVGRG